MNYRFTVAIATAILLGAMGYADVSTAAPSLNSEAQLRVQHAKGHHGGSGRGRHHRIDFAAAAAELGTTEAELKAALGLPENREEAARARFQAAASELGVTPEALRDALGITLDAEGRPQRPRTRPDLAAAAAQLNVTEAELRTAFGLPEDGRRGQRPRLDIAGAAAQFGVSEAELIEILGIPARAGRVSPE